MRTKAQRRYIRKGYRWEMIPLRPNNPGEPRVSYLIGAGSSWRAERGFGQLIGMPIRPICKQFIHNGRKP